MYIEFIQCRIQKIVFRVVIHFLYFYFCFLFTLFTLTGSFDIYVVAGSAVACPLRFAAIHVHALRVCVSVCDVGLVLSPMSPNQHSYVQHI